MAKAPTPTLQDFDLAPLDGFDPAALDTSLPIGCFILLLAAVFNDLKAAWYIVERLRYAGPIADRHLVCRGQVAGMGIQTSRLIAGILHELMQQIAKHGDVVDSSEFRTLVARLPRPQRAAWNQVQQVARQQDGTLNVTSADAKLLLLIRNNFAFHYGAKAFAEGYRRFFADSTQAFGDRALLSDGESMEATRFYFADAAMEEGLRSLTRLSYKDLQRKLSVMSAKVNIALKFIVTRYIGDVAKVSRYSPPT